MTRMDDPGEEFTIKFVNDFCNVERSVGDTATKGLSWYGIYPVPDVGSMVAWTCPDIIVSFVLGDHCRNIPRDNDKNL